MKQLHEYETPETNKEIRCAMDFSQSWEVVESDLARSLEQRLAACRDALDEIIENNITPQSLRVTTPVTIAKRALYLTAQKQ